MTACPLDCYDACQVVFHEGTLKGGAEVVTAKHLCPHLNHYDLSAQLQKARHAGQEIELHKAQEVLLDLLQSTEPSKVLFYRGSGNIGKMQAVSDLFFSRYGASLTKGSLCDAAGQAAIIEGRGFNEVMTPEQISQSEVVVLWGRNPSVTHSHLLPFIKGKRLIVIDPIKTDLAKTADLHIQIKPRGDFYLAVLLARFSLMEEIEDKPFIEEFTDNFTWFYDFIHTVRIKVAMEKCDIMPSDLYAILNLIAGKKVAFLVGASVQKYTLGSSAVRAIDSFAALLGLMGKAGCGVSFLGDSAKGVENPFLVEAKREVMATADFSKFDLIVFQGSNALESMPDSNRVREALEGKTVVYFGLDENATSQRADLVIPAKNFLAKEDIRFSYADHTAKLMPLQEKSSVGISEYELTRYLNSAFNFEDLESEQAYIERFLEGCTHLEENVYRVNDRSEIPYSEGFETDEDAFLFLEEFHDKFLVEDLFLITPKYDTALNTMFRRPNRVYVHPSMGFKNEDHVKIVSSYGELELAVKVDDRQREDTVCIYTGTKGLNNLTPSILDETGMNAVYQEISVKVNKC